MGRNKEIPQLPVVVEDIHPRMVANIIATQQAVLTPVESDAVLAAGINIGRLEAMDFVATIANSVIVSVYEDVKKSKAWRLLRNPESGDGSYFESLEQFCEVKLGKSYRRIRDLSQNRNLIGQEVYEKAEKFGFRQVDYNALKTLPAHDQELIRRAVEEAESRDEVLNLLQELAARHAGEKAAMAGELHEAKQEIASKEQRISVQSGRIAAMIDETDRFKSLPGHEALKELQKDATNQMHGTMGYIRGNLRQSLQNLQDHDRFDQRRFMEGLVAQIQSELDMIRDMFFLRNASEMEPEWMLPKSEWKNPVPNQTAD